MTVYSTLDPASFTLNPNLTDAERSELAVEVRFYGLLRLMMPTAVPYYAQEQIGVALLQRACVVGTKHALQLAVTQARAIVFEMGSTTPWLTAEFQDLRYVITDRVVSGAPVWAAENGTCMHLDAYGMISIGSEADCAADSIAGDIWNYVLDPGVLAPTLLPATGWWSSHRSTLEPQPTTADGVRGFSMRVTTVHALDDAEPAMAAALQQHAMLTDAA